MRMKLILSNILKIACFAAFLTAPLFTAAQLLIIYETEEDYKNDRGVEYPGYEYRYYKALVLKHTLVFKKKKMPKIKISPSKIWGFVYRDMLVQYVKLGRYKTTAINERGITFTSHSSIYIEGLDYSLRILTNYP